ncbi:Hypp8593 [Branchiostoma lanceolatum]|uniref:Hypp8593 protein n=1 Tax=Branchiostoma lanceolatum TaxID=7740 RepID=A0A8J9Z7R4_BRALA|nr:Hypp8593 [Branchiostoma lanceolatum]
MSDEERKKAEKTSKRDAETQLAQVDNSNARCDNSSTGDNGQVCLRTKVSGSRLTGCEVEDGVTGDWQDGKVALAQVQSWSHRLAGCQENT